MFQVLLHKMVYFNKINCSNILYIIEIYIKIELIIKRVKLLNFFIFKSTSTQIIVDDGIIEIISYIIKGLNIEERYYYDEDYH